MGTVQVGKIIISVRLFVQQLQRSYLNDELASTCFQLNMTKIDCVAEIEETFGFRFSGLWSNRSSTTFYHDKIQISNGDEADKASLNIFSHSREPPNLSEYVQTRFFSLLFVNSNANKRQTPGEVSLSHKIRT